MTAIRARLEAGSFTTTIADARHTLIADEPVAAGGADMGFSPYELLASALAACTVMTLRLYAERKGWPLQAVEVAIRHDKVYRDDCADCDDPASKVDRFQRVLTLEGPLDPDQVERLKEIAARCPVHRTLTSGTIEIVDEVELLV